MEKKSHDLLRTVGCLAGCLLLMSLSGCGVSFCGFRPGGAEELVFSCGEELLPSDLEKPSSGEEEPAREAGSAPSQEQKTASAADEEQGELSESGTGAGITADGRVNINTAGLEELMTLKGIGETRAKAILEYRSQHGSFTKAEDIMQIPGIKEGIYTKIQDQIIV